MLSIRALSVTAAALALAACEPSPFEPVEPTRLGVAVPPELALRAIEPDALTLLASVDGRPVETLRQGDRWELTATVAPNSTFDVTLQWCYDDGEEPGEDCPLPLGSLTRVVAIDRSDRTLAVGFDDFVRDADEDRDGASNYVELRDGFDPRNGNLCPDCRDDVDLTIVRRVTRPQIDGRYFNGSDDTRVDVWAEAQLADRRGRLFIDQSLSGTADVGLTGRENDVDPPKWGAMHDGRDLFVFVLGEGVPKSPRFDSDDPRDDDATELFVATPDGTVQIVVPVRDEDGGSNSGERGAVYVDDDFDGGDDDVDADEAAARFADAIDDGDLRVATCTCDDERDFYELAVSLDWLGLEPGDVFGLEVQRDDDDDGDAVDARWGWRAAPGSGRELGGGSFDTALPGRAVLE